MSPVKWTLLLAAAAVVIAAAAIAVIFGVPGGMAKGLLSLFLLAFLAACLFGLRSHYKRWTDTPEEAFESQRLPPHRRSGSGLRASGRGHG